MTASRGRSSPLTRWMAFTVGLFLVAAFAASCGDDEPSPVATSEGTSLPSVTASPSATEPASETVWLCRPGMPDNPCDIDLTTTVVAADGTTTTEEADPAQDPPVDCFYVYPTVSGQPDLIADLTTDPEETAIAMYHTSRFSQVCRVYAPMYRQLTLAGIISTDERKISMREVSYGDVLAAWQDYLANYNDGHGVVLIGHSQGTMMLTRLVTEEIDPDPEMRELLVSALLIGGNVLVGKGKDVGGDFENIPACRAADQAGCVVAYSSYLEPPPPNALFGKVGTGPRAAETAGKDVEVLCVNPASLSGGSGELDPYFSTTPFPGNLQNSYVPLTPVTTPWVTYPGMYAARCESSGDFNWLEIDTTEITGDTRPVVEQRLSPTWGLHLYDVNLALGNLVDLVREQAEAYTE